MGVYIGNGYGQATLRFQVLGGPDEFVVTHGFEDVPGDGDAAAAASAWYTGFTGAGRLIEVTTMANTYTFVGVRAVIGTGTGPVTGEAGAPIVGTVVRECLPANCSMLVRKTTTRGGRRGRGRFFFPPAFFAESDVGTLGTIVSGTVTALQARLAASRTAIAATDYPPRLLHESSEVEPDAVTQWTLQGRIATQRTRIRR